MDNVQDLHVGPYDSTLAAPNPLRLLLHDPNEVGIPSLHSFVLLFMKLIASIDPLE